MQTQDYDLFVLQSTKNLPVSQQEMHNLLGMQDEVGELASAFKKALVREHPVDLVNVKEELGDLLWYLTGMANAIGSSLGEVMLDNMEKLKKRYPEGHFTVADNIARADKK